LRVGAGVALALALGGASWSARSGGAGAVLVQPVTVCTLNAVTDGTERGGSTPAAAAAVMKTSVDALSDSLFRREDAPRDHATLMDLVFEQVTKEVLPLLVPMPLLLFSSYMYIYEYVHDIPMIELELVFMPCPMRSKAATGES
jgi:hypothetical protein